VKVDGVDRNHSEFITSSPALAYSRSNSVVPRNEPSGFVTMYVACGRIGHRQYQYLILKLYFQTSHFYLYIFVVQSRFFCSRILNISILFAEKLLSPYRIMNSCELSSTRITFSCSGRISGNHYGRFRRCEVLFGKT